ncbi:hypothetical protein [Lactococcus garvieae]|uniref:Uncharacterized protein n=1 Tax=Lactococcus garvieae TaxID=1363 RepID=A0AA46YTI6_9LACT|nr:hypothetical protein [Lactococcus garvieae]UYT10709.1 hypothetical protein OF801_01850 [Lactococcus garvieae]UYT12751.1 hypothetical protein OF800_01850 [Lactococcus garvieae]
MKKKITNYLTKYISTLIIGMAVFVVINSFEKQATPLMWIVVLITTALLAYTEIGGEDE